MDTPWLYIYTAHKLSQLQRHTLHLTSELTASKWLTIRDLILEGFYRDRGRESEARLELYTPAVTYLQVQLQFVFEALGIQTELIRAHSQNHKKTLSEQLLPASLLRQEGGAWWGNIV